MRVVPVLDLKGGVVVRGVAGRRQEYRPVVSRLTTSCAPADVALAFRARFQLSELYLADLDAIAGAAPAVDVYADLQQLGFRLWVDAGVRTAGDAEALGAAGVATVVVGLETVAGPDELAAACRQLGGERVAFSLDLQNGRPLGDVHLWDGTDVEQIAAQAVAAGVSRLIVLDLARVGVGVGTGTEELCRRLAAAHPAVPIVAGGGVRDTADLLRLRQCGARAALVASALHVQSITAADLAQFTQGTQSARNLIDQAHE